MQPERSEWRGNVMLPVSAALGYSICGLHMYGLGPYIVPIADDFGWSRSQTTIGITIATVVHGFLAIPLGMAVDRLGARIFALVGFPLAMFAFGLIGTATGGKLNWIALWLLLSVCILPVLPIVWTSAVAAQFNKSRGLALAITLCGSAITTTVFPILAVWLTREFGWRMAMHIHAAIWVICVFPLLFLFFKGSSAPSGKRNDVTATVAWRDRLEGFKSPVYRRLIGISVLVTTFIPALVIHFIPMLVDLGVTQVKAAQTASLIGVCSVVGRLGTGYLLDRISAQLVGAGAFFVPVIVCLLLLFLGGDPSTQIIAACLLGLALGAETDVIIYLTARYFGAQNLGSMFGGVMTAISIGAAIGSASASMVFDVFDNYAPFLLASIIAMLLCSFLLSRLPQPTQVAEEGELKHFDGSIERGALNRS